MYRILKNYIYYGQCNARKNINSVEPLFLEILSIDEGDIITCIMHITTQNECMCLLSQKVMVNITECRC